MAPMALGMAPAPKSMPAPAPAPAKTTQVIDPVAPVAPFETVVSYTTAQPVYYYVSRR